MRRYVKKGSILLMITFIATLLNACTAVNQYSNVSQAGKKGFKVGMVIYNAEDTFIGYLRDMVAYYIELYEEDAGVQIELEVLDSANNEELQNSQIDHFIKEGYDVILANTVDRADASMIIDKAQRAKIDTIFFNREPVPQDMKKWDRIYYVGTSAEEAGRMQGEILVEAINNGLDLDKNKDGKIQYVMIEGEHGHQDAILRTYHCIKVLEENGLKMENLGMDSGSWLKNEGKAMMETWLKEFGDDIEIVLSNNDEMALGAIGALKEYGYFNGDQWMPVIGVDGVDEALEAIENGTMIGTILNDYDEQAKCIVYKLYQCIGVNDLEIDISTEEKDNYFWVKHKKVTKENVDTVKKHTSILKK
ncbi:MAG: substrate-binding domain-containing protein [Epulopiscium sp.]|nr:substrate-binding domain-containing protein [Candidatus Epulonipiscium sp.]